MSTQSKLWIIVWNGYPENWRECFEQLSVHENVQWIAGAEEVGQTTGNEHIQGNIYFRKKVTLKGAINIVHEFCKGLHVGDSRGKPCFGNVGANLAYITKQGEKLCEYGDRPHVQEGGAERDRWKCVRALAIEGDMETISVEYFDIWLRYEAKLRAMCPVRALDGDCEVLWIYGPPGSGKDHYVRVTLGYPLYAHMSDKWFDDYQREDTIYFCDIDPDIVKVLGANFLKQLCDKWPCRIQVKNASMLIRPKRVIFTSNYAPSECLKKLRGIDQEAIKRRLTKVLYKTEKTLPPQLLT